MEKEKLKYCNKSEFKQSQPLEQFHECEEWAHAETWMEVVPESGRKNDFIQNGLDYNNALIEQIIQNKELTDEQREQLMELLRENLEKLTKAANGAIDKGNVYKKFKKR